MAYRFTLRGAAVECDTVDELMAAHHGGAEPTSKTQRARKKSHHAPSHGLRRGPSQSWAQARAYAKKHDMGVSEARSYLTAHPQARTRAKKALAAEAS